MCVWSENPGPHKHTQRQKSALKRKYEPCVFPHLLKWLQTYGNVCSHFSIVVGQPLFCFGLKLRIRERSQWSQLVCWKGKKTATQCKKKTSHNIDKQEVAFFMFFLTLWGEKVFGTPNLMFSESVFDVQVHLPTVHVLPSTGALLHSGVFY